MNNKIIIFGASGHAKSIVDVLEMLDYEIVGFIDSYKAANTKVLNYSTLGDENELKEAYEKFKTNQVVVGVGDIYDRIQVVDMLKRLNPDLVFPSIVSPKAHVSKYSKIGQGSVVLSNALINVEASIGEFCIINSSSTIEHNSSIGDFCNISPGAIIGAYCKIENNSFIGASASVIQNKQIGYNSVIGAGAVVTQNIPDNVLALGTPAKVVKLNYRNKNILK